MNYPINAEEYITAMRREFGPHEYAEEAHRAIIPLVNHAYSAGLHGHSGYPLDVEEECLAFAKASGLTLEHIHDNPLIPRMVEWINRAYAQGREERGKHEKRF